MKMITTTMTIVTIIINMYKKKETKNKYEKNKNIERRK